jgi:hypothetical protein
MLGRLTRILLLCLALCAVAPGAIACAAEMGGSGDCCPPDRPGTCRTDQLASAVDAAACCVTPVATSVVTIANERVERGLTSPPAIADSGPQFLVRVHHVPCSLLQIPISSFDRSQIYLQTGRLRL